MSKSLLKKKVLLAVFTAIVVGSLAQNAAARQSPIWVYTGMCGWKQFLSVEPAPADDPVDVVWIFSSTSDAKVTVPEKPPMILGSTGPWTMSETSVDPDDNPMPYVGIKYTLDAGGTPISETDYAWVVSPFYDPDPLPLGDVTVFLESTTTGHVTMVTELGPPSITAWVPPELTDFEEIYQYIIVHYVDVLPIPTLSEWGAIIFGALLLVSVAFYIRRWRRLATVSD